MIEGLDNIRLSDNANYVINQLREKNNGIEVGKALMTIRTTINDIYVDMKENGAPTIIGESIIPDGEFVGILELYGRNLDYKTRKIIEFVCSSISSINNKGEKRTIH